MAWMMMSSVLVFLMIPGVAFYYAGAYPQRMQIYMAWLPLMTAAVVGVEVGSPMLRCRVTRPSSSKIDL